MDEVDKFDAAQQQVNVLFQAAQSALLPARDHQVVTESARSLMAFVQEFQKADNGGGDVSIAMPQEKQG
jgi:hypothetical protein|tara:strand:- start:1540 stop:1746 length:207 start_codon:yes stop_codon:yes gene_type:complete